MDYSPFNPVVWVFFLGGLALVILGVKIYHRCYPNYPRGAETVLANSFRKTLSSESTGSSRECGINPDGRKLKKAF